MKSTSSLRRGTKIVCTIGPSTSSPEMIERLIRAGMNVARFNLSHGELTEHDSGIGTVRELSRRLGTNVAILVDLPGPKYRTGALKNGEVSLRKGATLVLTTRKVKGNSTLVSVNLPNLPRDVKTGNTILLADGAMQLVVEEIKGTDITCRVTAGGILTPGRGLVVPGMRTSGPFVTASLKKGILFAIEQQADFLALSFVSQPDDIADVQAILNKHKKDMFIISKIERGVAVRKFDAILQQSDGIMVARGDLGVDIPLERVPLVQKEIIRKCNRAGKPVITATEMLESMVNSLRPTRAETTDVANAIFDGTDAIMLSAETSIGKYPVQSVRMMAKIAAEAERNLPYEQMLTERGRWLELKTDELISYNACHAALRLGAAAIVAFTKSGSTAGRVSKYRPKMPVLAITPDEAVCRQLLLRWGVHPVRMSDPTVIDELIDMGAALSRDVGIAGQGDSIVITAGIPLGVTGTTNLLKVHELA